MPPVRVNDLERALQRKGFEGKVRGGHVYYFLTLDGKHTGLHAHRSLSDKELHDGRISQMARELKISPAEFREVVDCTQDHDGLIALLRSKGVTI